MTERKKLDKEIKELVLWRLDTSVPTHFKLSVGGEGTFSKEELREHVEKEDEIGLAYANMQLSFIKAIASGEFSKTLAKE